MERIYIASVVSEIQQSDIYLTVKARLFDTPGPNLNGVRVTAAFLDEIVENPDKYVGLPLCADIKSLANGDYEHLGHLYDASTGEFHSAQIGSFYKFEKETTAEGAALIGYARILKRNKAICHALSELFADGALKFSFEISCGAYRELDDGTIEIDASQDNFLEGVAVVSFPACESAVALDLVAECNNLANNRGEGENIMQTLEETVVVAEEQVADVQLAEEQVAETPEQQEPAESVVAEEAKETEQNEERSEETAELLVTDHHYEAHEVDVYDTDTGMHKTERTEHETHATQPMVEQTPLAPTNAVQTVEFAQTDEAVAETEEQASETAECDSDEKKEENAEVEVVAQREDALAEILKQIAELKNEIVSIRAELAQPKEDPVAIVAEVLEDAAQQANPFVGEMELQPEQKYSLLESETKPVSNYSLLDRA